MRCNDEAGADMDVRGRPDENGKKNAGPGLGFREFQHHQTGPRDVSRAPRHKQGGFFKKLNKMPPSVSVWPAGGYNCGE